MIQASAAQHVVVGVISDLHVYDRQALGDQKAPSAVEISDSSRDDSRDPLNLLGQFIEKNSIRADYLLCPGDLSHQAHPLASRHAWDKVHFLAKKLGNAEVIATAGNHDVDSRMTYTSYDAKGHLQELRPNFPLRDEALCDRYWSRHFAILEYPLLRVLVINSSAYHGYQKAGSEPEYVHGRISERTINAIEQALSGRPPKEINLCLLHHHPIPFQEHRLGSHDLANGGFELVELLGRTSEFGEWFIVHGHKHCGRIRYAQGTATAPVVFGAGSVSANLQAELLGHARNQFYLISFAVDEIKLHGGCVGTYRSWTWTVDGNWTPSLVDAGLPARGGFGSRQRPLVIARNLSEFLASTPYLEWRDACQQFPDLQYMLVADLQVIVDELRKNRIEIGYDQDQLITFFESET